MVEDLPIDESGFLGRDKQGSNAAVVGWCSTKKDEPACTQGSAVDDR